MRGCGGVTERKAAVTFELSIGRRNPPRIDGNSFVVDAESLSYLAIRLLFQTRARDRRGENKGYFKWKIKCLKYMSLWKKTPS